MLIELSVRRLFCDHDACDRRTFAEQVEGLTVRYGRRTPLLRSILEQVAVALAGRAGARLAGSLQATVSRSTMLRLVMALPDPPPATPRVLGVDDFALRRGHVYGTLLVDCETTAPLDLLAGREAQPLVAWLRAHPGVEVICLDRSGAYAEGARCGAPDAVQVADRFHLWQNLGKAVEGCVARHRACLRAPGPGPDAEPLEPQEQTRPRQVPVLASEEAAPTGRFAERARRHHALVHDLLAQGHGLRAIARRMGWGRHTVQRYARAASWQELVDGRWQQQRPSKLDPFKPTSSSAGSRAAPMPPNCTGRSPPWACRQLRAGARLCGAAPRQAGSCRADAADGAAGDRLAHPPPQDPDRGRATAAQTVLERCAELRAAAGHVRAFGELLTRLRGQELPGWIAAVRADGLPGLSGFAAGLEHDIDAVACGLTIRWSSGPVEGRVNHIKMLKRQMYGRAGLPLLRKRVLLTAARRQPCRQACTMTTPTGRTDLRERHHGHG